MTLVFAYSELAVAAYASAHGARRGEWRYVSDLPVAEILELARGFDELTVLLLPGWGWKATRAVRDVVEALRARPGVTVVESA